MFYLNVILKPGSSPRDQGCLRVTAVGRRSIPEAEQLRMAGKTVVMLFPAMLSFVVPRCPESAVTWVG